MADESGAAPEGTQGTETTTTDKRTEHERAAFAKRDEAKAEAKKANDQLAEANTKLAGMEEAKAKADGDVTKQFELVQKRAEEAETRAAEAENRFQASEQKSRERTFLDEIVSQLPGGSRTQIRGFYLSLCEDGKIERHSEDNKALEKAVKALTKLEPALAKDKETPKDNTPGGPRVPTGFSPDTPSGKKQSLAERMKGVAKEQGTKGNWFGG